MLVTRGTESIIVFVGCLTLLLVVFRIVGSVRLGETMVALQRRYAINREIRSEIITFENLELQFHYAASQRTWWKAVCVAARQFDFAWISLRTIDEGDNSHTTVWRSDAEVNSTTEIVTLNIPLNMSQSNVSGEIEIAIARNGSLEAVTRRASLFGRLIDGHDLNVMVSGDNTRKRIEIDNHESLSV
ncbi:hypothetical protein ACFL3F_03705, partial [Planctomycetota bacterium]